MKKFGLIMMASLLLLTGCNGNVKDGVAFLEAEKYEEAIEVFREDIDKKRNLDEAYHGLGIAYFELGQYEDALEAFELALKHEAEETPAMCAFMGACYLEKEELSKALDIYEKALSKKEISKELKQEIEYNLIGIYEDMGNWEAAKTQMQRYVKAYPEDTRVEKEADFLETR